MSTRRKAARTPNARPRSNAGSAAGNAARIVVGVDTGGTFTDIVYREGLRPGRFKLLSTPDDPARAVLTALAELFAGRTIDLLTYGTTVATNAMLERRGARTVLVTTAGFEDVLEIGRQARPDLYALEPRKPRPLIDGDLRIGVAERTLFDGAVQTPLTKAEMERLTGEVAALGPESIAVCLLHAHIEPGHERRLGSRLAKLGVPVTLSHEISPEPGEYERTATTVANAYVRPRLARHIDGLARNSGARIFRVLQSNGGATGAATAAREPVRTMLSGPAGGVAAAERVARRAGFTRLVTFDMGGTSTDVALVDGEIPRRSVTDIGGVPVRSPCIDIHTVGAGGGSIAWVDAGGSLKVGPKSAGADPGPACYGRGDEPTVTDANLVLGRLRPESFLGGHMRLDVRRAERVIGRLAAAMGAGSLAEAAEGVVRVVEGNMERAIRVITVEAGQDPRTAALVAFGGAAGLHACGLARELAITNVVVPDDPGLLSAVGVMDGPVVRDDLLALNLVNASAGRIRDAARPLIADGARLVALEGVAKAEIHSTVFVRARYVGQSLEVELPLTADYAQTFHETHERLYRHRDDARDIEVSGLRVTTSSRSSAATGASETRAGRAGRSKAARARSGDASIGASIEASLDGSVDPSGERDREAAKPRAIERAEVYLDGRSRRVPVFDRAALIAGAKLRGPAIVVEYSSTVLVAPRWSLAVDEHANLILTDEGGRRG